MTAIVAFKGANLPAPAALATSLKSITTGSVGGEVLLKMDKTGHWVYGADQTEIEDKSEWAVNPFSFVHGFIAWGTGEVLAEKMAAITDPLPELDPAPAGSERGWEKQLGFHLRCVSGEDDGLDVRFATTSVGGKRAVSDLAMALAAQVEADPKNIVAVLTLDSDAVCLVVETGCQYFLPVAFPDVIHCGLRVAHLGTSSVRFDIGIFRNADDTAAAQGHFVHVCCDRATQRPQPFPAAMRAALEKLKP